MVLVAAPAGYGKTTFLAQWEDADERPFAWITLDERYDDPVLLLGFDRGRRRPDRATRRRRLRPAALAPAQPVERRRAAPLPRAAPVRAPVRDRPRRPRTRLHNPEALGPLPELAAASTRARPWRSPRGRSRRCRSGRLRTQRRLGEVGARADDDHARGDRPARAGRARARRAAVERLVERTEGWPAGLYLAALALAPRTTSTARSRSSTATTGSWPTTCATLPRGPAAPRARLPHPDLAARPPLSDRSATRSSRARARPRRCGALARSNMLAGPARPPRPGVPLPPLLQGDAERRSSQRRGGQLEIVLHQRASHWYAEHDDIEGAVKHAIAAGDRERGGRPDLGEHRRPCEPRTRRDAAQVARRVLRARDHRTGLALPRRRRPRA